MDKFEAMLGDDPKFCPMEKIGLFMKKGIVKELPWKTSATIKKLLQL